MNYHLFIVLVTDSTKTSTKIKFTQMTSAREIMRYKRVFRMSALSSKINSFMTNFVHTDHDLMMDVWFAIVSPRDMTLQLIRHNKFQFCMTQTQDQNLLWIIQYHSF